MTTRTDELMAYMDRLIAAERGGYYCQREMSEVIDEIRGELFGHKYGKQYDLPEGLVLEVPNGVGLTTTICGPVRILHN